MKLRPWLLAPFVALVCVVQAAEPDTIELEGALDPLLEVTAVWDLTPDKLEALFPKPEGLDHNPFFAWLTSDRSRAIFVRHPYRNVTINLSLEETKLPVEEAVVDFRKGRLNGVTFSIFNRGDGGSITAEEFKRRGAVCDTLLRQRLEVTPSPRRPDPAQGHLTQGWTYFSIRGLAVLEFTPEADQGTFEFLRLRLAPREAEGPIAAAIRQRRGGTSRSALSANVHQANDGDVFIEGIPMVDQGSKGYCVVASAQRLFEYYGISCDQHQIAQIADTNAERGTNTLMMMEALKKIDGRFQTHFKGLMALYTDGRLREMRNGQAADTREFSKQVHKYVDGGIPLLWSLELGRYPEVPPLERQAAGGHMRLIIGYNDKTNDLLFSDSWGAGHELKRMKRHDAYQATQGLFAIEPTTY